jgi:hypothetical protein
MRFQRGGTAEAQTEFFKNSEPKFLKNFDPYLSCLSPL